MSATPTCPVDGDTHFAAEAANSRCLTCRGLWAAEDLVDPRFLFLQSQYHAHWMAEGETLDEDDGDST